MIKYRQIMEHIYITPEMETRILSNLSKKQIISSKTRWLKYGTIAACIALAVCCFTIMPHVLEKKPNYEVQAPNNMQEFKTVDELANSLSFPLSIPTVLPNGYSFNLAVNQFGMAQVIYTNGTSQFKYYMQQGTDNSANSAGYSETKKVSSIELYGNGDGYLVAAWTDGTYSYSLYSDTPMNETEFVNVANSVAPYEK